MANEEFIQCRLCPRGCVLSEGQRGNCRVRINSGGKIKTLVYGKPCAVHIDPIEKKPMYHMYPATKVFSIGTAGCNLHCKYCQNWEISQSPPEKTNNYDMSPEEAVKQALERGCRSIAYTYNDPVVFYEYMFDTAKIARRRGLKNVCVTAGYINSEPLSELCDFLDGVKVDLKAMSDEFYRNVCFGELRPVLETLKTLKERKVWTEIVYLIVPTLNDAREDLEKLIDWILDNMGPETPLHFSRFWPQYQLKNLPPTPIETLDMAWQMAREKGLNYAYVGNVAEHPGNNTYCPKDGKLLIKRVGYSILEYNIASGKCKFCGNRIPGLWE
ncbi:MAG: AmmeMemoRadiSam system radical SAM enzyme [Candidatus Omnitrophota bacterium]